VTDLLGPADVSSAHAIDVAAAPAATIAAMQSVCGADLPLTGALMTIRTLGRRRTVGDRPVLEGLERIGARPLSAVPERLEYGLISQPWRLTGGESVRFDRPEEFASFARPGFVRVQVDFWAEQTPGGSRLRTATRVRATDPASLRSFKRYWRVVGPGSGLIRREWLRAARRRAEA
jgi:hypothetical protein